MMRRFSLLLSVLLMALGPVQAQPLRADVSLTRPIHGVSTPLTRLSTGGQPAVALLASQQGDAQGVARIREAVYNWELLLLGLKMPYRVLDDRDLARGLASHYRVLILPAAEALSDGQQRQIERFVERGGGLIASGRTGLLDAQGRPQDPAAFFEPFFGAAYVTGLPEQPYGLFQTVEGSLPLADGLPMGYCLNLAPQVPLVAARPTTSTGIGRPFTYSHEEDQLFDGLTLILTGQRGGGRFLWTRFNPQDIARTPAEQEVYQGLMLNALAYVSHLPSVSLRPWPNGFPSATTVAVLPTLGFEALRYQSSLTQVLDLMDGLDIPGSFFLNSNEATAFPGLLTRMEQRGEVGVSADNDELLAGQGVSTQLQRVSTAAQALSQASGGRMRGLFPPSGAYDENTFRALLGANLDYITLFKLASLAPTSLSWWDRLDVRESLASTEAVVATSSTTGVADPSQCPPPAALDCRVPQTSLDFTIRRIENMPRVIGMPLLGSISRGYEFDYDMVHNARGLYIVPVYPDLLTPNTTATLTRVLTRARTETWMTTLDAVYDWWLQREQLDVTLTAADDDSMVFEVINSSPQPIAGAGFDVRLPRPAPDVAVSGASPHVRMAPDGRTATLVFPTLPTGNTQVTVTLR
jgi:hypothetical protein